MEELQLFKRMLGLRSLIKTACQLDQAISHYITYVPLETGHDYEVVLFAHAQVHPKPAWVVKILLRPELLSRVMQITFKMIKYYDKLVTTQEECHAGINTRIKPSVSKIIHN